MPDQNPIVEAGPSGVEGVSAFSPSASRSSGILAGRFRWVICGLLFLGVTKNYMDRQVLGVLKIPLQHEFGWNDIHYGHLVFAFQAAYALGMILVGRLIDRLGTRNRAIAYRLCCSTICPGFWRGRIISGQPQVRGRMVSKKGAGAGNRHL